MMQKSKAVLLGLTVACGLAMLPDQAHAQAYPNKPIRMVIPYTPGGFTDTMARSIGDALARALGQPMVYDNKPGANSLIGAGMVAKAAPDGYTLATVIAAHSVNPSLYQKMPFDAVKDFTPVTLIGVAPLILVANVDAPFNNVKELIDYAKAHPGKLAYGSSGTGAAAHLTTEYFNSLTGTKMTHVPYKGTAGALTDLIGGQIHMLFDVVSSMGPHIKAGKVKPLPLPASSASARSPTCRRSAKAGSRASSPRPGACCSRLPARRRRSSTGWRRRQARRCAPKTCARSSTSWARYPSATRRRRRPRSFGPKSRSGARWCVTPTSRSTSPESSSNA